MRRRERPARAGQRASAPGLAEHVYDREIFVFLDLTERRNPALIRAAAQLHQSGAIPANTYVIDLDSVRHNARVMAEEAKRVGIRTYLMTKHYNRNPLVTHIALDAGLDSTVAVDVQCVQSLIRFGLPVGHVGHLVQIPKHSLPPVLRARPEVMTLFSVAKARQVSEAAVGLGMVQNVMLRVRGADDLIYPNEEGGIWESELEAAAKEIESLPGVRITGLTTFPATLFNPNTCQVETTPNFETVLRAKDLLISLGFSIEQVNAPGAGSARGFSVAARHGGTVTEPGHGLTGTTPTHLYDENAPEQPSIVYVSEVSHLFDGRGYVFGGGFYACDTPPVAGDDTRFRAAPWTCRAFVGRAPQEILGQKVAVDIGSFFGRTNNATDYYGGTLLPSPADDIQVGDSVVYGFRPQVFTTRAHVAVVTGIGSDPRVLGVFDRGNNLVDQDGQPQDNSTERVKKLMRRAEQASA
jgi:predicted amino acid racemase